MKSSSKGNTLVLLAVILWSLTGMIIKTVDASSVWINLIRSFTGALFLSPFVFKEKIKPLKSVCASGLFMSVFLLSLTLTTRLSSSAMAISMQYSAPMYVIGYSFYHNKRVARKKLVVVLFILIGVVLNMLESLRSANLLAMVTGIATGISFIFYSYYLQRVETGSSLGIVAIINAICTVFFLILLPFNARPIPSSMKDILLLCFAGIVVSGLSYALYGAGVRQTTIETALMIGLAEPILNPIWVYMGTKELPPALSITGIVFILIGAVVDIFFRYANIKSKTMGKGKLQD